LPLFSSKTKNYPSFFFNLRSKLLLTSKRLLFFQFTHTHGTHRHTPTLLAHHTTSHSHKANFTPRQCTHHQLKKRKWASAIRKPDKTTTKSCFSLLGGFFLLLWLVSFVSFSRFFPPSPNHFGIATKAEAPAKKTDRDSNNSNENEIINKKNKRLLSRRQAPQVCGFSCKRTTAHVKHVQGGRNVQTKPKSYDNGFCGILVSLFFFHIIRWLFSMIVLLLFLLVICLLFGLVVGSCFLFLFFFVLGTCGWEWVLAFLRVFLGVVFGFRIIGQDLLDFVRRLAFNQRGNFRATQMKQRRQIHVVGA